MILCFTNVNISHPFEIREKKPKIIALFVRSVFFY